MRYILIGLILCCAIPVLFIGHKLLDLAEWLGDDMLGGL